MDSYRRRVRRDVETRLAAVTMAVAVFGAGLLVAAVPAAPGPAPVVAPIDGGGYGDGVIALGRIARR